MNLDYQDMLAYALETLTKNEGIKSAKPQLFFRNRYEHIVRVYGWTKRILPGVQNCLADVVLTAAIFHDIGYRDFHGNNHAELGKELFQEYAAAHQLEYGFTKQVSDLILMHSNKALLCNPETPIELVVLMEADLLDEEGALGIVFDLLAEGYKKPESYTSVFQEIMLHSAHILEQNYMVTPLAKKYWDEKKTFIEKFIKDLKFDLFME